MLTSRTRLLRLRTESKRCRGIYRVFFYSYTPKCQILNNYLKGTPGIKIDPMVAPPPADREGSTQPALNIDGRRSDGAGGYRNYYLLLRQFFQWDHVQNVPGVEVAWNEIIHEPGKTGVEDNISLYISKGTPCCPIEIHDNYIDGNSPATRMVVRSLMVASWGETVTRTKWEVPAYIRFTTIRFSTRSLCYTGGNGHHIELDHNRRSGTLTEYTGRETSGYSVGIPGHANSTWNNNSFHDNKSPGLAISVVQLTVMITGYLIVTFPTTCRFQQ